MSHAETPDQRGFWQALNRAFSWGQAAVSHLTGLTLFGVISTLLVAYFQNLSAYHDKVATQAKEDLTAATQTFTEAATALSGAISLQQRLVIDFYSAQPDAYKSSESYLTKDARDTFKDYIKAYTDLHQNYNLLARKAEIYLDWASDTLTDAAHSWPFTDPMSISFLGAYNFNCETDMPDATGRSAELKDPQGEKPPLIVDWHSAQHNVLAIEYCFDVTHKNITAALQWASQSTVDADQLERMTSRTQLLRYDRATSQILRLNAFMTLAMSEIERIRIKYRPNGFLCGLPGIGSLPKQCVPIRTR